MRALVTMLLLLPACACALEKLPDAALAKVAGRDGMSFNLSNFSMGGNAELRYYTGDNSASFAIANMAASRSDNSDAPFADPYRLDVVKGPAGFADIITLSRPANSAGREVWQYAFDLGVSANGIDMNGGCVMLKDLAHFGGGMQWSTPQFSDGLAWGYSLHSTLGSLSLLPNGRDAAAEAMVLSGIQVGAANDGAAPVSPWKLADVVSQPGIFNARTDAGGNPSLHIGIGWPDASGAPSGTLQVQNISFNSASGNVDLGASRIGAIQIQYLDVKFRP
ncbi:MAG: hypothetical protein ACXWC4_21085 [Telluria sp.]